MTSPPLNTADYCNSFQAMITALNTLHQLSALDNDGLLTRLGRRVR